MRRKRFLTWWIAAAAIVFLLIVLYNIPPNAPGPENATHTPSYQPTPSETPMSVDDTSCRRPYPDESIWNVPINWSIASIHPMSDGMMDAFFKSEGWIGADTSRFTPNVYWVSNSTPLVSVRLMGNRFRDAINDQSLHYGEPAGIVQMPLPADARPAAGTDGQLVVINVDTGEEWGLNKGYIDSAGNWFAGGVYRYHIENSGIPPQGFGQRGAGIGQLAGIVRRCEVDRGRIEHAVTLAYDYPCEPEICRLNDWPASIPPFRKTDGRGNALYDIPEGARLAIRPDISQTDIEEVCDGIKGCLAWILAMQEYGGFVVDNSDHPKTYAEGNATANWDPSVWSSRMLRNIPQEWYVVIDWNTPSTQVH
jgi:hypothetical protein